MRPLRRSLWRSVHRFDIPKIADPRAASPRGDRETSGRSSNGPASLRVDGSAGHTSVLRPSSKSVLPLSYRRHVHGRRRYTGTSAVGCEPWRGRECHQRAALAAATGHPKTRSSSNLGRTWPDAATGLSVASSLWPSMGSRSCLPSHWVRSLWSLPLRWTRMVAV